MIVSEQKKNNLSLNNFVKKLLKISFYALINNYVNVIKKILFSLKIKKNLRILILFQIKKNNLFILRKWTKKRKIKFIEVIIYIFKLKFFFIQFIKRVEK